MSAIAASVLALTEQHDGLALNARGQLEGKSISFVEMRSDPDVPPAAGLSRISHGDKIFYLVPDAADLPAHYERHKTISNGKVLSEGRAVVSPSAAAGDDIASKLGEYAQAVRSAGSLRRARELLAHNRSDTDGLFASARRIEQTAPMLVDGLVRLSGVSVFFGDFDEFKTTLVLDMAAHVAAGAPWQGRSVQPRPVVWYALEGIEEIPVRLRALEAKLSRKQTPWGADLLPIVVRDRIPEDPIAWRTELVQIVDAIGSHRDARNSLSELQDRWLYGDDMEPRENPAGYPTVGLGDGVLPVVVIDTLSMALGGDEKGADAPAFVKACLDLLKARDDLASLKDDDIYIDRPVAEHVVIIHHQTKTGTDFAGHRAIGADTHGLYRVHRFGKMTDRERPYAGQLTPLRVKGMARPAPVKFAVEVVPVEGTKQTAAILEELPPPMPEEFAPIIEALRELPDPEAISREELNRCIDLVAGGDDRSEGAKRLARSRIRKKLEEAGVIEALDDDGKVYRFHG